MKDNTQDALQDEGPRYQRVKRQGVPKASLITKSKLRSHDENTSEGQATRHGRSKIKANPLEQQEAAAAFAADDTIDIVSDDDEVCLLMSRVL